MPIVRRKTSGNTVGAVPVLNTTPANRYVLVYDSAAGAAKFAPLSSAITGTPDGTKFLRDDLSWKTGGSGGGLSQAQVLAMTSIGF